MTTEQWGKELNPDPRHKIYAFNHYITLSLTTITVANSTNSQINLIIVVTSLLFSDIPILRAIKCSTV